MAAGSAAMWVMATAAEGASPPPSFQVVLPPQPTRRPLNLSPGGVGTVGEVIVVAPRAEPQWSRRLNLDPKGDFAKDATPYLARSPHNGCKAFVTSDATPMGVPGVAGAAKLGCAFSFW